MRKIVQLSIVLISLLLACGQQHKNTLNSSESDIEHEMQNDSFSIVDSNSLQSRFPTPLGYVRTEEMENSFANYLRNLPLKSSASKVKYYNGDTKQSLVYEAVVAMEIGNKNLHQCADAVMRLRAEHLWEQKQYDKIHFNFTNGFRVDYSKWLQGKRVKVSGNSCIWVGGGSTAKTYENFWKYMELIFTYAGTLSLSNEMESLECHDMQVGDVFIQGGSPGHAVIVVDMAVDSKSGKKLFMLAQSYMPAQDIQILKNPQNKNLSPWYSLDFGSVLNTPEWTFYSCDLKRFEEE